MFQKKRKQILRRCLSLVLAMSMTVPVQASALSSSGVEQPVQGETSISREVTNSSSALGIIYKRSEEDPQNPLGPNEALTGEPFEKLEEQQNAAQTNEEQGWILKDGNWYYYNEDGSVRTGWIYYNDEWYFLSEEDGSMVRRDAANDGKNRYFLDENGHITVSGWASTEDNRWYYADDKGILKNGWQELSGEWYYLDPEDCHMHMSEVIPVGEKLYYVNGSGQLHRQGWTSSNGGWVYAGEDAALVTGWFETDGELHYADPATGIQAAGWLCDPEDVNKWYYFGDDGKMVKGWVNDNGSISYTDPQTGIMKFGWQLIDGLYYYFNTSGIMVIGWLNVDGKTYYMNESGALTGGWQHVDGKTYYMNASGEMQTGWQLISGIYYYFGADGSMQTGWVLVDGQYYYLSAEGHMQSGWQHVDGSTYFLNASGVMQVGWQVIGGQKYYFDASGRMQTGWILVDGKYYYMNESGVMQTGWVLVDGKYYYLNTAGEQLYGWQLIDGDYYYLNASGEMQVGWQTIGLYTYYLNASGVMQVGWQLIDGSWYFMNASGIRQTGWQHQLPGSFYLDEQGRMVTGWREIDGDLYYFESNGLMVTNRYVDGKYLGSDGKYTEINTGKKTIKSYLQIAMEPVGSTLYIWGGGHDDYAGGDGVRIGVNPQWEDWFNKNGSGYDWTSYRYKYGYGLDCSGFVGWTTYNVMNTESNQRSYASTSTGMPSYYAGLGFGKYYGSTSAMEFTAGDVVSMSGHTWIVVGQCDDGSVVIVHATPPGVQISGTVAADGTRNSEARALAEEYMDEYFPEYHQKFNFSMGSMSYLKNVNRMQWDVTGTKYMSDPDGYTQMDAEEILEDLFENE